MKHVLITGGAGFIGSHLCDLFLARGYAVTALDNLVTGSKSNLTESLKSPNFQFIECDVTEVLPVSEMKFLKSQGLSGVLHFACPASPVDFDKIPLEILKVDSIGTMNTVELALHYKSRYLVASTSEVYGDPLVHPQDESYWGNVNTVGHRSCYDETKRFAEAYVYSAKQKFKLNAGIVRIFNTYGPRMRPDDGRVVPELCIQALTGKDLSVHSDGNQTRSFCYVSDLVEGIFRFFESEQFGPMNLGNPTERKIVEFANTVIKLTGTSKKIVFGAPRPDDPKRRCPVINRAKTWLKWEPQIDLEEGLKLTLDYFRGQLEGRSRT